MNVPTISMDPTEARARAEEYEQHGTTEEDAAIARSFRALQTRRLVSLRTVFGGCPRDAQGRPKLAIGRADRTQVRYFSNNLRDCFSVDYRPRAGRAMRDGEIIIERPGERVRDLRMGFALLPLVPPTLRWRRDMRKYFILWEVTRWADEELRAASDVDPYLLRRLDEDLFVVHAEWLLSDLEQEYVGRHVFRR